MQSLPSNEDENDGVDGEEDEDDAAVQRELADEDDLEEDEVVDIHLGDITVVDEGFPELHVPRVQVSQAGSKTLALLSKEMHLPVIEVTGTVASGYLLHAMSRISTFWRVRSILCRFLGLIL